MATMGRREMLKLTAGASVVAGMMALTGCSSSSSNTGNTANTAAASTTPTRPLPADVANLKTIVAKEWVKVSDKASDFLEGPTFDKDGNLFICHRMSTANGTESEILKIGKDGKSETFAKGAAGQILNGLAFHKDGRLFAADVMGHIVIFDAKGTATTTIDTVFEGHKIMANDLVFNGSGDLYITDFSGNALNPAGGVYRLTQASGYAEITPFQKNMCTANGICFAPDYSCMWVVETALNRILRIRLNADGTNKGSFLDPCVVYQAASIAEPDSMRTDASGNFYAAINPDGRGLVFNNTATPVANILLEDRDKGTCLTTTAPALAYSGSIGILASIGSDGAKIYKFEPLADAAPSFYTA